ncbi:MAG: DUF3137 domain-containing protein [Muribaculaceae bacterium]|nr:DUF3137 domain-containing protein [Muribaculaceae bacterium]
MVTDISKEEFFNIYNELEPKLEELEIKRKAVERRAKMAYLLLLFTPVISIFLFAISIMGVVISFIILFVISNILSKKIKEKFRQELKREIISKVMQQYGDFSFSDNKKLITLNEIKEMGFYQDANKQKVDDVIIGKHKNCNFAIVETSLTHKVTNSYGDNSATVTVSDFQGIIVKLQSSKNFEGKTVIGMKGTISKPKGFEKVELESSEFMKYRHVYSTNQIEARYILTPSLMERLSDVGKEFITDSIGASNILPPPNFEKIPKIQFKLPNIPGKQLLEKTELPKIIEDKVLDGIKNVTGLTLLSGVNAAFIDGYVYLYIPTIMDFFEPPTGSLLKPEAYFKHLQEVRSILKVIEYLHLDKNIGL